MITDVRSWDDWFELCGELKEPVAQYENYAYTMLVGFNMRKEPRLVEKDLEKYRRENMKREFYLKPPGGMKLTVVGYLKRRLPLLAVIPVSYLVLLVFSLFSKGFGRITESARSMILPAVLIGFGVFLLGWGFSVLGVVLKWKSLSKKLAQLEEISEDQIKWVPPKYRNSFCLEQLHKLWQDYSDMTFSEACESVDAHLRKYGLRTHFRSVMFDIPYEKSEYTGNVPNTPNAYESEGDEKSNPAANNPNLPPDIASKTFSGSEDAEAELAEMVGMESVKDQLKRMKNRISFYGSSNAGGGQHIAFLGSAGTGKTVTARIVTRILYDFGYIKENKCVEIDGDYLKSPYVGQTGERTAAIVQYAMGGVLFIDEAYLLYDKNSATAGEAVGVLLKAMEDNRKDFVVIFAGYPDQMNRLLNMNEGFASRIKYRIYFDDYTVDELWQIFMLFVDKYTQGRAYVVDANAEKLVRQQFAIEKSLPHFGNARTARNAVDAIMDYHADNCMSGVNTKEQETHITEADVKLWLADRAAETANDTRNFVGASDMDESIITTAELKQHDRNGAPDPEKALKGFIGLAKVKEELEHIKAQKEFYGEGQPVGNMFFVGPPGTGKTSIVPVVTGYLYQMGCIRDNRYVSVTGDFLRGIYVGQTGRRVQAVVQYSIGGVLFIDEVAALCNPEADDSFGNEAFTVLQQAMSEHEDDLTVVFAGTNEEIDYVCRANPGLEGLVRQTLHFTQFTARELCMIFKKYAAASRFTVDEAVWAPLQKYFLRRMQATDFGNAREAQKLFEDSRKYHIKMFSGDAQSKFVIGLRDVTHVTGEGRA